MKTVIALTFFILSFILIIQQASAGKTCRIILTFFKDGSVRLDSLEILTGESEEQYTFDKFRYSLQLLLKNNVIYTLDLDINFYILTDPPREKFEKTITSKIPCLNAEKLRIYDKSIDKIIFEKELSNYLCNKNDKCEPDLGENYFNCLTDCHCSNKICEKSLGEDSASCPQDCPYKKPTASKIHIYVVIIGIIIVIIAFLLYKIRMVR